MLVGCLCAADQQVLVVLSGDHDGAIGLQVEVLLTPQLDGALQNVVSSCCGAQRKDRVVQDRC